jgi:hypothetical protein
MDREFDQGGYRKSFEVVGYTYDAALHCLDCTEDRFGIDLDNPDNPIEDSEGNPIHPIFLDSLEGGECCDDCFEPIE